jgi:hypothetical protein
VYESTTIPDCDRNVWDGGFIDGPLRLAIPRQSANCYTAARVTNRHVNAAARGTVTSRGVATITKMTTGVCNG